MIINGDLKYKYIASVTPVNQSVLRAKKAASLLNITQLERSPNRAKLLREISVTTNSSKNSIKKRRARTSERKNGLAINVLKK
jgi:hypothetical protein